MTRFKVPIAGLCAAAIAFGGAASADPRDARGQERYGPPQGQHFRPGGVVSGPPVGRREGPPVGQDERPRFAPYAPPLPRQDYPRGEAPRGEFEPRGEGPSGGWRTPSLPPPGVRPYAGRMVSLGWVIDHIQRQSPGRQLDAEIDILDGREVYRVMWVTVTGRRIDYLVDASTGAILSRR